MKQLQFIASLQLVESALQVCPDNVPEKIEKQFNQAAPGFRQSFFIFIIIIVTVSAKFDSFKT